MQQRVLSLFTSIFEKEKGTRDLVEVDFPNTSGEFGDTLSQVRAPKLGPHAGEHGMKDINRCWKLLKYLRYNQQASNLASNFSHKGCTHGTSVEIAHVPGWMRPKQDLLSGEDFLHKSAVVKEYDALPPLSFGIVSVEKPFPGSEDLEDGLEAVAAKGIDFPKNSSTGDRCRPSHLHKR